MIALAFWYVAVTTEIEKWRELGPFLTLAECRIDRGFYIEGGVVSECYRKGEN